MVTLYALIPEERLSERLAALAGCLNLSIQLLDENGLLLQQHGCTSSYCALMKRHVFRLDECAQLHLQAGKIAYALGESYIFSCRSNLTHVAFSLVHHKQLLGAVIIGPFLMDQPDSTLISDLSQKQPIPPALCLELCDALKTLPVVPPRKVTQIGQLTDYLLAPLLKDERALMLERQEKLSQQSRINETIQMYKGTRAESSTAYIYQKEKELLSKVKACDICAAKALLNDLLGFVLFAEGSKADYIQSRALELTTLLSRVTIEGGAPPERIFDLNHLYLSQILKCADFESLCFTLQEIVEDFIRTITLPQQDPGSLAVRKALQHIAAHFDEPLSIQALGDLLGMSPAYFSSLFARHMKIGFHDYLTRVRVEESKHLLTATDYPISQIAVTVGYADQSSFTKAFKRVTGITPHQLR